MSEALLRGLVDSLGGEVRPGGFAIAPGIVTNNVDLIAEGKVQVRIPSIPAFEPWARLSAAGAGSQRGFLWTPQLNDEVLCAFNQNDERDAYILGGLWSTIDRPPAALPTDFLTKRVIKTGVQAPIGHEIVLDDLLQSIEITTSTFQKVTIDPTKIRIETTGGSVSLELNLTTQTVSIIAPTEISMKSAQISMEAGTISIKGGKIDLLSAGPCTIQGLPVKIN
jgi:phage baseplate assembly protein gpV